ncbi:alpha/beta fold hydrolase [Dactylosporangium sp. CS-047395]|uniref:alpha/beta fold hydrolase n=1 Tax=Dactylosporangium sp. CS-047395 TaxID=3239936 RepID=UPI003D8EA262
MTQHSSWSGLVSVDDTALYVTDSGGPGRPVIYLNGAYADQSHWRKVIAELGDGYRHIAYDERARGKSQTSADYSFEACLRDLDAVLAARGVTQAPILVGWSYGGTLAWHFADRHPERVAGVVVVDSFPIGLTGPEGAARIRKLFRRMRFILPLVSRFGLSARMSVDQHADVNIEVNEISAASGPVLVRATRPVHFVLATGDSLGSQGGEMDEGRKVLDPIVALNPNVRVAAKVPSNHSKILRNDSPAVAAAVRNLPV